MKFWSKCHSLGLRVEAVASFKSPSLKEDFSLGDDDLSPYLFFFINKPLLRTCPLEIACRSRSKKLQVPVSRLNVTDRHSKEVSLRQDSMHAILVVAILLLRTRLSFNLNPMTRSKDHERPEQATLDRYPDHYFVVVVDLIIQDYPHVTEMDGMREGWKEKERQLTIR